ncbi:hydrolase [Lentzea sp. NBRC 105346]|uniref:alpha/beta fold hydrolase n=1 Tax=Lentzea sp. NBRC 105346 TaxID=3032205 RepID=UPI0024A24363|nr:alpha/beta hydrolase [Lentzea sp. NBRC 105346]GLZ31329.1 hydrolase [Lentzea sp. NBRC 105346]
MTTLRTPDGVLYYEVRGKGPLLILTGSPMAARFFAPLADALASEYTVVTHDPRGISASVLDDPSQDSTPDLRADDLAALIAALGFANADVFGSSGGGVTGLALVARYPDLVRTLVAHEPPVFEFLPDAAEFRVKNDALIELFHREGVKAAMQRFLGNIGLDGGDRPEPSERDLADSSRFFAHEFLGTTRYVPDVESLKAARVVVGVGATSGDQLAARTAHALAERLDSAPVVFPGGHGGFLEDPAGFAEVLRRTL